MSEMTTPGGPCCANPDEATAKPCALCEKPTCKHCRSFVDRKLVCADCRDQIEQELAGERAGAPRIVPAIVGGAAGALAGAGVWALVAVLTDFEVGYVALAIGWLAGQGVVLGAGGKKGVPLQVVAVLCSVVGLTFGKYFTVAHYIKTEVPEMSEASYLDPDILQFFFQNFSEFLTLFDILWIFLALGVAWKVPMATRVAMSRRREA